MDGSTEIKARFLGDVKGTIALDYQYEITDPIQFVQSAKFITSSPTDVEGQIDLNTLERAENSAIDKLLKDVVRGYLQTLNPIDIDESQLETEILTRSNKLFTARGIVLQNMSLTVDFFEQTEQALDVISASKLYESAGAKELGDQVIIQQAGRPIIQVTIPSVPRE